MKIVELIDNPTFNFNVKFRIVKYSPTPYDPDYVNVLYDGVKNLIIPTELLDMEISAINQNDDTVDLEVY